VLVDPIRDRLAGNQSIELLALGLAAWCRRLTGRGEQGEAINVIHPLADMLRHKALEGGGDPAPILALTELFGPLGRDQSLIAAVGRWLRSIYADGIHATLATAAKTHAF
jgi:mannitol 2-dehydrogenase